jgi:hypothetical protein
VHYAWVVTPTGQKIYVDGSDATLDATNDGDMTGVTMDDFSTSLSFYVGARNLNGSANEFTAGNYADFRIYDADIGATEIANLAVGTDYQTNLVGHWLTDNDDVEDKAGTNDGTNFGSTYSYDNPPMDLVPSRQASRSFDGVNDYVELADPTNTIGTNYSFTAWANFGDFTANGHTIFSIVDSVSSYFSVLGRILYDQSLNTLIFQIRESSSNGNIVSVPNFNASAYATGWHHYAFVRTGDKVEGFIDGVSVGSDSSSAINTTVSSHYFDIGTLRAGFNSTTRNGNFFMTGGISDFRHYDASLTASQILDIYNGTTDRTNLVGQWLTNSDDLLDHAGTNDGTNFGSTYSTDSPS